MRKSVLLIAFITSLSAFAADVAGKWSLVAKDPSGNEIKVELSLKHEGDKFTGAIGGQEGIIPLQDVQFKDNVLTYKLEHSGMAVTVKLTLDGDKLKGTYTAEGGVSGPLEADRMVEKAVVAASPVVGDWKVSTTSPDGSPVKLVLTLKQEDGKWSGQMVVEEFGVNLPLTDIKVDGASFTCNVPTEHGTYALAAKVTDDKLEGNSTGSDGAKIKMTGTR